jgi:hypothetical protein
VGLAIAGTGLLDAVLRVARRRHPLDRYFQGGDPDECLRIGLQFSDGTRTTSLDHLLPREQRERAPAPLRQTWGGGQRQRWWVHPLPPPGPILFVLEWPAAARERVTAQLDGDAIREAASRSIRFWDDV